MIKSLSQSPSLFAFLDRMSQVKERCFFLEEIPSSAKALFLAHLQEVLKKDLLIITSEKKEEGIFNQLSSLLKDPPLEFPSWDILPGESLNPSSDVIGKRTQILDSLSQKKKNVSLITSFKALLQKVMKKETLKEQIYLKVGQKIPFSQMEKTLTELGYQRKASVFDKGDFSLRTGIVDIFSLISPLPHRIEFFGDEISSIRTFDPSTQKSLDKVREVYVSLANEKKHLESSITSFFDYLSSDVIIIFNDPVELEEEYVEWKKLFSSIPKLFFSFEDIFKKISNYPNLFFFNQKMNEVSETQKKEKLDRYFEKTSFSIFQNEFEGLRVFHPFSSLENSLKYLEEEVSSFEEAIPLLLKNQIQCYFLYETASEKKNLEEIAKKQLKESQNLITFETGYLTEAFLVLDSKSAYLPYGAWKHKIKVHREQNRLSFHSPIFESLSLQEGDFVVHLYSGIGIYRGIEKIKNGQNQEGEFFLLEYANKSKLFVPINQAHLLTRYIGSGEETPFIDTLGSNRFTKIKAQAQRKIMGYAEELLKLYAERVSIKGYTYPEDSEMVKLFEEEFPYEETIDQLQAIKDIKKDMMSPSIMDRLILGDVGYGKTEVAMRAAFKVVVDGKKQVAVLVPTTILAMQHFENFSLRMSNFPVEIGVVSRFNTIKKNREILEKVEAGKIDILIGTHRMLSKDVFFKNLGLLIVDEEQRFGVRAKESIKHMKKEIDSLSMSATPIPRTLYLSLIKARDLSVINTPPQDRLPVKTFLVENDDEIITQALMREHIRGGQVFFIHNRVESIAQRASHVQTLAPNFRIAIVHGQMDTDSIDEIFHLFKLGEFDILFSTTILENGIDIPNANTILIDHAEAFGISDLYQLRGRVGRWNKTAFAYFLIPKKKQLSEISQKRLLALVESGGFGSGMKIALKDLEIRGAGDILGEQQSGQISTIGFHLYSKLLKQTIEGLKDHKTLSFIETKIDSPEKALFPEEYIPEVSIRMELYQRLGELFSFEALSSFIEEIKDRFGTFPKEVLWLYHLSRIKIFASQNQFTFLKFKDLSFHAEQRKNNKTYERTFIYPKKFSSPLELENFVIDCLKKIFECKEIN